MRTLQFTFLILAYVWMLPFGLFAADRISAADAAKYIGKSATVCGRVASATYASRTRGEPTFINLDRPYPNQIFTAVIWGDNRSKFSPPPESAYSGKRICVTGRVSNFKGQPEIIVRDPAQIATELGRNAVSVFFEEREATPPKPAFRPFSLCRIVSNITATACSHSENIATV